MLKLRGSSTSSRKDTSMFQSREDQTVRIQDAPETLLPAGLELR